MSLRPVEEAFGSVDDDELGSVDEEVLDELGSVDEEVLDELGSVDEEVLDELGSVDEEVLVVESCCGGTYPWFWFTFCSTSLILASYAAKSSSILLAFAKATITQTIRAIIIAPKLT